MTENLKILYDFILEKKHHSFRTEGQAITFDQSDSPTKRVSKRLVQFLAGEKPVLLPGERIALTRTQKAMPDIFNEDEMAKIRKEHFIHELGYVCNISPDYSEGIARGLEYYKKQALDNRKRTNNTSEQNEFFDAIVLEIDAIFDLCDRYQKEAEHQGNKAVAELFEKLPRNGAGTFHEALQMFRILHFVMWCEGSYQVTVGRFDQYMFPYLRADLSCGRLNEEEAFDLLKEFFLTFNRDSDLYIGSEQQGDNGQSLMLGGVDRDGKSCFNLLSEMCLRASKELKVIDPKINLRVNTQTPTEIYQLATELTKEGLGFPQYANDDVVIPGLTAKGYSLEDARDYTVAACWEFIIPRYGMDVPNIGALSFPKVVDQCLHKHLESAKSFEEFLDNVKMSVIEHCEKMMHQYKYLYITPAPFMSIFMSDCFETGNDISFGGKYNNYGFHGTGLSTAVDSLAAIQKYVFEEKTITANELVSAVKRDFDGDDALLRLLRHEAPKMGNDDDDVDKLAVFLLDVFADALDGKTNDRGGVYRPGTGSAMYYLWHADELGASCDGRRRGEPLSANYAPSLFTRLKGPISVVRSFTKPDMRRTMNGGPLTMEFHDSVFRGDDGIKKVASLVEYLISLGGHQYQLNAVNRDVLLEAQRHPERYRNLIVRIWGWSAYFNELDVEFQNHVIARQEYTL